jgi:transposase
MNRLAETLIDTLHTCPIPETTRLGRTLRQWRDQILAYVATGGVKAAARRSTSSSTRPAAYRPRLPQLTNYRLCILLASHGTRPYRQRPTHA